MMKLRICSLLLTMIVINSCCNKVDCIGQSSFFEFKLTKNNQDVLFGEHNIYVLDSIYIEALDSHFDPDLQVNEINENLGVLLYKDITYILHLSSQRMDTITSIINLESKKSCCNEYELTSVSYNQQQVCLEDCEEQIVNIALD